MEISIIPLLLAPLTPSAGVLFILVGLYSLHFNAADARRRNHPRGEKIARIGGWLWVGCGAAMLLPMFF